MVSLCFLLEVGDVSAWVLLVIVAREFLVSGLRMVVASRGTVVAASSLGKWKTATTMVSISGLLLCRALPVGGPCLALATLSRLLLLVAVVLTAWSGADYFAKSWGSSPMRHSDSPRGDIATPPQTSSGPWPARSSVGPRGGG